MSLILIVDDEPDMRLALSAVLKKQGHSIVEAEDGETALEELSRRPVELVLLDIRLPGMDGVQMLKLVRQRRNDLPVVMVTGYGSVETAVQVMKLGADGYLSKPFGNRELVETVERVLQARRLSQEGRTLNQDLADKLMHGRSLAEGALPVPLPVHRPWKAILILGLLAALIPAGIRWMTADPVRPVAIPFGNPTALAWQGDQFWAADWVTAAAYRLEESPEGVKVAQKVELPKTHLTGLALVGEEVFTSDGWRKMIQRRKRDAGFTLVNEVASPGPSPSGLFWDGQYLWSCDAVNGRIYQHARDEKLTVVASYPSPGKALVGLFKDEHYLWSADAETRRFYQHRLDDQLTVLAQFELTALNEGSEPLSAVTFHSGSWWAGRDGKTFLLRFPERSLKKAQ